MLSAVAGMKLGARSHISKYSGGGGKGNKKRAKTPQMSKYNKLVNKADSMLQKQHFEFLSKFESKKDAYLQNFYES